MKKAYYFLNNGMLPFICCETMNFAFGFRINKKGLDLYEGGSGLKRDMVKVIAIFGVGTLAILSVSFFFHYFL